MTPWVPGLPEMIHCLTVDLGEQEYWTPRLWGQWQLHALALAKAESAGYESARGCFGQKA